MKYILIFAFFMFAPANYTVAQETKDKSCGVGCCGKEIAMAEMQSHDQHKHETTKQDTSQKKPSLLKQKMKAMAAGKYNCCIEEPCDECLKAHGSCSCKKAVKDGKPVCDECYEGWKSGHGDVSGKTMKDIKKGHVHKH